MEWKSILADRNGVDVEAIAEGKLLALYDDRHARRFFRSIDFAETRLKVSANIIRQRGGWGRVRVIPFRQKLAEPPAHVSLVLYRPGRTRIGNDKKNHALTRGMRATVKKLVGRQVRRGSIIEGDLNPGNRDGRFGGRDHVEAVALECGHEGTRVGLGENLPQPRHGQGRDRKSGEEKPHPHAIGLGAGRWIV
jgi:hypothetical protein